MEKIAFAKDTCRDISVKNDEFKSKRVAFSIIGERTKYDESFPLLA